MNRLLLILLIIAFPCLAQAGAQSEHYKLHSYVVNSAGTTHTAAGRQVFDTVGEAATGPQQGSGYAMQAGFFSDFYMPPPTPTITCTPIRTFGGEILSEGFVFAAPNPMRGNIGHIYFDLAMPAEVTMKIYTTTSNFVISKNWDNLPAGTNKWDWEMGNMSNGVYFLLITARSLNGKESRVTKKIAIIH